MGYPEHHGWAVEVPVGYVIGDWTVTKPIATGSWGSVYAARRQSSRSNGPPDAALKFLPAGSLTPLAVADFRATRDRESAARTALQDQHIIETRELLTVNDPRNPGLDGATVLVMELAQASLQQRIDAHPGRPLPDAPALLRQLALAIQAVHSAGWIHADVKPANILLTKDGLRLTDFGLATRLEEGTHGYLPPVGSHDYLPPEAMTETLTVRGRAVRSSRDVWAFGVVAYQLLTGRRPFAGDSPRSRTETAATYARGRSELLDLGRVPESWRALVGDCLQADPRQRSTIDQVLARMDGGGRVRRRWFRPWVAVAGAVVTAVVIATAVLLPHRNAQEPQVTPKAGWRQVFRDDFNGTAITDGNWYVYDKNPDHPNYRKRQVSVSDGMMRIRMDVTGSKQGDWLGSGVSSGGAANRANGRYLARVRVSRSSCLQFAVLLFPGTGVTGTWSRIYSATPQQDALTGGLWLDSNAVGDKTAKVDLTQWHVLGIDWTHDRMQWTLDGSPWRDPATRNVPQGQHVFAAQVERADESGSDCVSAELQIDWVAVYAPT